MLVDDLSDDLRGLALGAFQINLVAVEGGADGVEAHKLGNGRAQVGVSERGGDAEILQFVVDEIETVSRLGLVEPHEGIAQRGLGELTVESLGTDGHRHGAQKHDKNLAHDYSTVRSFDSAL